MSFESGGGQRFPYSYDQVFSGLLVVLQRIEFTIKSHDKDIGRIECSSGMSLLSWGENISITVEEIDSDHTRVNIQSGLKVTGRQAVITAEGRNAKNVSKIIAALSSYLKSPVAYPDVDSVPPPQLRAVAYPDIDSVLPPIPDIVPKAKTKALGDTAPISAPPPPRRAVTVKPKLVRVSRDGQDLGDVALQDVRNWLQSGELTFADHYFNADMGQWLTLDCHPDLK